VKVEERVEQFLVADLCGIEIELDDFGVAGLVGADVFVGGALHAAALIAHGRRRYAGKRGKRRFHTPKTACAKRCFLCAHSESDAAASDW
jgi:hypothetical protein